MSSPDLLFSFLNGVFAKNERGYRLTASKEKIVKKRLILKNAASIQIQKVAIYDSDLIFCVLPHYP